MEITMFVKLKKKKRFESIIFQTLAPIMMGFFFVVIRVFKVYNKVIKQYYHGNHFFFLFCKWMNFIVISSFKIREMSP